ncbi:MAG: hypothetical protein RL235_1062, partial [Chlamydiota bacterium]
MTEISELIVLVLVAMAVLFAGKRGGFFRPLETRHDDLLLLSPWHVATVFLIYFLSGYFIIPEVGRVIRWFYHDGMSEADFVYFASWANFLNSSIIAFSFALMYQFLPRPLVTTLWGNLRLSNFGVAAAAWAIGFPIVTLVGQIFDFLVTNLFHLPTIPDQLAVHFLKLTFGHPLYFSLAIITIVILAPFVEETMFRGFLQTYIRRHLGTKAAIGLTSMLFALFHYSTSQGFANIPIIAAL